MAEDCITLAHGAGGRAMAELIDCLFLSAFGDTAIADKEDQARITLEEFTPNGDRLAFTTDSFVVTPLFFPGGDIGKLAVCGTVNDLAVGGAIPKVLSAAFILEEGLPISVLQRIVYSMGDTAKEAGVTIQTGDTKVVGRGMADGVYINTSGIGVIPSHLNLGLCHAKPGDRILVSGSIGDHGAAVMLAREELGMVGDMHSDCAPLNGLIQSLLGNHQGIKAMRDATRGGLGCVLHDIAKASHTHLLVEEDRLPIRAPTHGICELMGLEPWFMANEGMVVLVVAEHAAEAVLQSLKQHPYGTSAAVIGTVTNASPGVTLHTSYGGKRLLDWPYGLQLPRIC
ncbi:hydrogenase expression/formation protein HypE [Aliiglaciecola sp. CAU 1673]|uniref:hydrogenase expression/formation protein HypE n=1 Tax=Aliiglaciecola sp. CAU 1673 TaxID=3032595 RepID=UPI0023D9AFA8|nr:hydrogenase expression/formation protein HypE [Aliiglaciecola sp. CAU 1673]MDF2180188.1 hydrogenase expression/formation protein HypE [Aliiglaciecola sp. CAU 1673]